MMNARRNVVFSRSIQTLALAIVLWLAILARAQETESPVVTVNREEVSYHAFVARLCFEQVFVLYQADQYLDTLRELGYDDAEIFHELRKEPLLTWYHELLLPNRLAQRVLDDLIGDLVLAQQAAALGIQITDEQIDLQSEKFAGGEVAVYNRFVQYVKREMDEADAQIQAYFERLALRAAVYDAVTADVSQEILYVNSRHILVATEAEALDIIVALAGGESFADLARQHSRDVTSRDLGGELGWAAIDGFTTTRFADAVRAAPLGETVGPVETELGWHVIQVEAREMRPMTAEQLALAKDDFFSNWLAARIGEAHMIYDHDGLVAAAQELAPVDLLPQPTPGPKEL